MRSSDGKKEEKNLENGKKKINFFLVFLIAWLIVITGFIAWFLLRFNDFAAGYEAKYQESLPYHTAEEITGHFNDHDIDYIWNNMNNKPSVTKFEDESAVKEYIASLIAGKSFIYSESENFREDAPEYNIKTEDGLVVACVKLAEDDSKKLPYGFKAWRESSLEFYTAASFAANINVPETYKVFVNGIELEISDLSGEIIPSELTQYVEPYAVIPGTASYRVTGLFKKPAVTAVDFRGDECEMIYDEATDTYSADFVKEFDEYEELSEFAISFASTFANYISQDAGKYALDKYFPSGSKALSYIKRNSSRDLYTTHGNVSIHNEEIKDCIVFSENVVYMEVYVEQWMEMYWGADEPEVLPTDAHVYFVKIDGKWLVGGIQY